MNCSILEQCNLISALAINLSRMLTPYLANHISGTQISNIIDRLNTLFLALQMGVLMEKVSLERRGKKRLPILDLKIKIW